MHFAAKTVVNEFDGIFPSDYNQLIRLKGIGDYTASAIASISGNQPYAVVDGNVTRVLSRLYGITNSKTSIFENKIKVTATKLLDKKQPGTFNQALMEFGALQCKPSGPDCESCIFRDSCFANLQQRVHDYPPKKKVLNKKVRHFHYFVIFDGKHLYIQNRKEKDIWAGLFEFPLIETSRKVSSKLALNKFITTNNISPDKLSGYKGSTISRSILSHQVIHLYFHELIFISRGNSPGNTWIKINKKDLINYAFPSPVIKYLEDREFFNE
jgi:A/G-specific adenine glycosylase